MTAQAGGQARRGGYIFITWKGDHPPRHVHVYSDGRPIEKWDLDNQKPMKGAATRRILELIAKMEAEGCCEDSLCQTQQSEKGVRGRHIEDFFVALNLFDTFDSRPATTSVDRNDVGIVLSFGWTYQRSASFPMTTENSTGGRDQPHRVQSSKTRLSRRAASLVRGRDRRASERCSDGMDSSCLCGIIVPGRSGLDIPAPTALRPLRRSCRFCR